MNKRDFIFELRKRLSGLPQNEIEDSLAFYSEIIDDRIEEGLTEQQAVSELGSVDKITVQIISNVPLARIAKERIKPKRRLSAGEIVLLALGSPIWISLAAAAFAVIISLFAALYSVLISMWAVFVSLAAAGPGGLIAGIFVAFGGNALEGVAIAGASVFCAGLSVFAFLGCKEMTKATLFLTKKMTFVLKKCFMRGDKSE